MTFYYENCTKGGAYSIYKVLYCLVVFERGKEEHVHCELEHEKLLSQVMARKKWQMGSPANQDVFNSQELLLCKATDVALRGCLHFTRFVLHLLKVYQIQNKLFKHLISKLLQMVCFDISK